MEKHVYDGVEYEIEIVDGKPIAVYLNGKRVVSPLADQIIDDFKKRRPSPKPNPEPEPTKRRPKP